MRQFFQTQLDYVFFFYGLGFIILAAVCWGCHKRHDRVPWLWLGAFGLMHGLNEWLDLLARSVGDGPAFSTVRLILMTASFVALMEFARRVWAAGSNKAPGWWVYAAFVLLAGVGGATGGWSEVNATVRHSLGVLGGLGAAVALIRAARRQAGPGRKSLQTCGIGLGLYALAAGLIVPQAVSWPASVLNHGSFFDGTGIPIQLVRGLLALCVAASLWYYREAGRRASVGPVKDEVFRGRGRLPAVLALTLIGGWMCTHYVGQRWDGMHRHHVLARAETIAATLDSAKIARFAAGPTDVGSQEYQDARRALSAVVAVSPDLRFAYLTRLVGDRVVFLVDSEPSDSEDYSPPGEAYPEASPEFLSVLRQGRAVTEGPLPDRYGVWVSGLVPVRDDRTGQVVAALGVDIDARDWEQAKGLVRLFPIGVTGLLCAVVIGYLAASQRLRASTDQVFDSNRRLERANHDLAEAIDWANAQAETLRANEQVIRQSEAKFRSLFESSRDALMLLREGRFIDGNAATLKMFGCATPEEFCSFGPAELSPTLQPCGEPSAELAAQRIREAIEKGSAFFEWRHRRVDGTEFPAEVLLSVVSHTGGQKLQANVRDITERKLAEEALRESQQQMQQILDAIQAGVMVVDCEDRTIVEMNPAALAMMGRRRDEVIGQVCNRFVCPAECANCPVLDKGQTVDNSERALLTADGQRKTILNTVVPVTLAGRNCLLESFVDVSSLKRAQRDLQEAKSAAEQASRAKSDFLANMSHEIRTPLNGVVGMVELLSQSTLSSEQTRYARALGQSAETLLNLVNDILDFSKIEAGKLTLDPVAFDLRSMMEEVAQAIAPNARGQSVEVIVRYDEHAPRWVVGDPVRIRQVVTNLAGNSAKFTERGHILLDVRCVSSGDGNATFHLAVEDTGIGIPHDKIEAIFEKFSQADASITRKFAGTGLGLAISSKLLAMMGGRIWVESVEGEGATFHVELTMELGEPVAEADKVDSSGLAGLNVLIVDDNSINRDVLSGIVRTWHMRPTLAAGGAEALERLETADRAGRHFDLALVDVNMPHMDGLTLADRLRKSRHPVRGPIVMLSSSGHGRESALCREMGLPFYLVKPVRSAELLEVIQVALRGHGGTTSTKSETASVRPPSRSLRVLLAEDNRVNQEVAVGLLENLGHSVTTVENGREAVSAARMEGFDLIFMDIQMPEMSGFEATAEIRAWEQRTGTHVPIVAMTANALKGDAEKCIEAGMDEYVSKPISSERLKEVIAKVAASAPDGDNIPRVPPEEEPAEADEPPVLDLASFLHRCSGTPDIANRVLNLFVESAGQTFEQIRDALAADDLPQARLHAHSLKGAAANLSAEPLRAAAFEMERLAEAGDGPAAADTMPHLQTELGRCLEEVQEILKENRAHSLQPAGNGETQ